MVGRSIISLAHRGYLYVERVEQQRCSRHGTTLVVCYSGIREEKGVGIEVVRRQMHSLVLRLKMFALVHGQTASSATEAVALRAELTAVADFAKQLALVLGTVCRVERFAAKTCNTRSSSVVGYYGTFCWMYSSTKLQSISYRKLYCAICI